MSIKAMILGVAAVASVALPGVASAQNYGGYGYGYGNGGYYGRGYDRDDRRDWRDDRHDRHRWEQQRRWEERQRRHAWQRERHHHDRDGYYGRYGYSSSGGGEG